MHLILKVFKSQTRALATSFCSWFTQDERRGQYVKMMTLQSIFLQENTTLVVCSQKLKMKREWSVKVADIVCAYRKQNRMTNWSHIMLSKCLHDRRKELVIMKYGLASKDKRICLKNAENGLMNTVKYSEMKLWFFMRLCISPQHTHWL